MLTKEDLSLIDERLDAKIKPLLKEITELFVSTNERIDMVIQRLDGVNKNLSERIDKVILKLEEYSDFINNHERRIEKLEEKVIPN